MSLKKVINLKMYNDKNSKKYNFFVFNLVKFNVV